MVRIYDSAAQFEYLKNFRRSRIEFTSIDLASRAFSNLDNREMEERTLKCYYAQVGFKMFLYNLYTIYEYVCQS